MPDGSYLLLKKTFIVLLLLLFFISRALYEHAIDGWKETEGNRQRGTVREEVTERRDGGEETERRDIAGEI
jgi:hypothetical protein